jgi:hypothetical protein
MAFGCSFGRMADGIWPRKGRIGKKWEENRVRLQPASAAGEQPLIGRAPKTTVHFKGNEGNEGKVGNRDV